MARRNLMIDDLVVVRYEEDVQRRSFMSRMMYAAEFLAHDSLEITSQKEHIDALVDWRATLHVPFIDAVDPDTGTSGYHRIRRFLDRRMDEARYR